MGSGISRRRSAAARAAVAVGDAAVPAGRAAENQELLKTVLAESEEAAAALPVPGRRAPAAGGIPSSRDAEWCGEAAAGGGSGLLPEQAALSTRSPPGPENNNADHQCPQRSSKKSVRQSTISYDYSEEELMASIEREYCR